MELRILITGCCANEIEQDVIDLKNNGIDDVYVVGVDIKHNDVCYVDKYYQVHKGDTDDFIDDMLNICNSEGIDVVIPTVDVELVNLANNVDRFNDIGTKVCVMNTDALYPCVDKAMMYHEIEKLGFDVPKYRIVTTIDDIKNAFDSGLICVKNPVGFGSRGIRILNQDKDYFDAFLNEKPHVIECSIDMLECYLKDHEFRLVMMEYIKGYEYSTSIIAKNGNVLFIAGKENVDVVDSSPSISIIKKHDEAYRISCDIVNRMKLDGFIGIDFIIDENDRPNILEINPRITATAPILTKAGVNYLYTGVMSILGNDIDNNNVIDGVVMKRRQVYEYFDKDGGVL